MEMELSVFLANSCTDLVTNKKKYVHFIAFHIMEDVYIQSIECTLVSNNFEWNVNMCIWNQYLL